jgi:hypothetical protein
MGNNMKHLYGHFTNEQMDSYKVKLHKELFWLLIYQDPKTKDEYLNVDFNKYFDGLMRRMDGLNELLSYPTEIVAIMSLLEAALIESRKADFNYQAYRKLVLDAHSLVDKIGG